MTYKMAEKTKWRKILYEDQGVPDNYVDESFLDELKKNLHIRTYNYWTVAKESCVVVQQLSSVCIFVVVFVYMDSHLLSPETLVCLSSILSLLGYLVNLSLAGCRPDHTAQHRTVSDDVKTALIFIGFSYSLSPVLVSLTETVATDSIYAMTFVTLLANLFFHDYSGDTAMVSGVLSLNAGLFASVCLASRLHTSFHSFATVTFAVQVFALWPVFRRNLQHNYPSTKVSMSAVLSLLTAAALLSVSMLAAIMFCAVVVFITFVCPAWLIALQQYKNNIHGPWDEAVPEFKADTHHNVQPT